MLTELGKILTDKGFDNMVATHTEKEPAVLGFMKNGKLTHYKVVRIDVINRKVWAKPVKLYDPKDIRIEDKK